MRQINWIYEVRAMSMLKKELEDKIDDKHRILILWWCLCDYFAKHEDPNTLLNHEKTKLVPLMDEIRKYTIKKMNTERIKRNTLTYVLKEKYDYIKCPNNLMNVISGKFLEEHIDKKYWKEVIDDFIQGVNELINILCDTTKSLDSYIRKTFNK